MAFKLLSKKLNSFNSYKITLVLILLFNVFALYSQATKPLVYKNLYDKFLKVQFSDPNLAKKYLDSILKIPNLPDSLVAKTYNELGINQAIVANYPKALHNFKKALHLDKKSTIKTKANLFCNIANTQKMTGNFDLALKNFNTAQLMYTSLKDQTNTLKVTSEICGVYYNKSDYNKALEISSELIPQLEKLEDKRLLNIQLLRMANIQFNIGDFASAITNYKKTLHYFNKNLENNIQNKYIALMNIGECYSELGNVKALQFLKKAQIGFLSILDERNETICLSRIGKYYYTNKKYDLALPYLKQSYTYFSANLPHLSIETFTYYINNLYQQKQFKEVKKLILLDTKYLLKEANLQEKKFYYETISKINFELGDTNAEYLALKSLQTLYKEQQKENTFEELQKKLNQYNVKNEISKNKNLELKLYNLKLQNLVVIISVLFLIMAILYLVNKNKKKTKIHSLMLHQLEQQNELEKRNNKIKDMQLQHELDLKKVKERELTALKLKVYQIKTKVINFLKVNDQKIESTVVNKIITKVETFFENEDYWKDFELRFTAMHPDFIPKMKFNYPNLTKKDIDFLMLIKLNLNNKEIATLINISYESVLSKKYLLRKKMNYITDSELILFLGTM